MKPILRLCTLLLVLLAAERAAARDITIYCDCDDGLGPCGNGATTDVPGGCLDSLGAKAFLFLFHGSTSVGADDLELIAAGMPPDQTGLVYMGAAPTQLPFGDGLRCVAAGGVGLFRFPVQTTGPSGEFTLGPGIVAFTHSTFPAAGQIQPGSRWHFQAWFRDPAGPCGSGFNLTNGLSITFQP